MCPTSEAPRTRFGSAIHRVLGLCLYTSKSPFYTLKSLQSSSLCVCGALEANKPMSHILVTQHHLASTSSNISSQSNNRGSVLSFLETTATLCDTASGRHLQAVSKGLTTVCQEHWRRAVKIELYEYLHGVLSAAACNLFKT